MLANLTRDTPYTITQPGLLAAELRQVHRVGYAQTNEEMSLGACSVAVPIRSATGGSLLHWASSCRASSATGRGWSLPCRSRHRAIGRSLSPEFH